MSTDPNNPPAAAPSTPSTSPARARKSQQNWYHFIGREHYTPESFVAEAKRIGFISRDTSPSLARAMEFGDRVFCADWRGDEIPAAAFCAFKVSRFFFSEEIAQAVGDEMVAAGRCRYDGTGAGTAIQRECGEWINGGAYVCNEDVSADEIFERAERAAKGQGVAFGDLWVMVGGKLTAEYLPPQTILPRIEKFFRGFSRVPKGARVGDTPIDDLKPEPIEIVVVNNYDKTHA